MASTELDATQALYWHKRTTMARFTSIIKLESSSPLWIIVDEKQRMARKIGVPSTLA